MEPPSRPASCARCWSGRLASRYRRRCGVWGRRVERSGEGRHRLSPRAGGLVGEVGRSPRVHRGRGDLRRGSRARPFGGGVLPGTAGRGGGPPAQPPRGRRHVLTVGPGPLLVLWVLLLAGSVLGAGSDAVHDPGAGGGGEEGGGGAPEVGGEGGGDEHGQEEGAEHEGDVAGAPEGLAEEGGHGDRDRGWGGVAGGGDGFAAVLQELTRRRTTAPLWPPRPIEFEMATSIRASRLFRGT